MDDDFFWKICLSSGHSFGMNNGVDDFFERVVLPSGYPMFEWNGRVYTVDKSNKTFSDSGETVS